MKLLFCAPSTHPAPIHLAAGLAARGHALTFVTAFAVPSDGAVPAALPGPARAELERRRLPSPLTRERVVNAATVADIARVATNRAGLTRQTQALTDRMVAAVQARVTRLIRAERPDAVYGTASMSQEVAGLCDELGIPFFTYLPQPTVPFLQQEFPEELMRMHHGEVPRATEIRTAALVLASSVMIEESVRLVRPDVRVVRRAPGFEQPARLKVEPECLATTGDTRLVYAGRMTSQKRIEDAIEATRLLREEHGIKAVLTLYTSDESIARDVVASAKAEDFVRIPGSVPRSELAARFAESHALVLPSLFEGFGLVVPEALGAGLPVITTPRTAGGDLGVDGIAGRVVPVRSPEAIAEAVKELVENPAQQRAFREAAPGLVSSGSWADYEAAAAEAVERELTDHITR
ncbi:glycosyltransferase family 4 protein [Falsarthrobacter nasiphocae]|uniref:Glycosyltransferase involved in cell wall biosynthesis n=1 Tax=Falsarthrobacter nasiphocae TaxID=189863 RepID=A0AAE3YHW3_9MICC|nr:glycosyltransferase family 4 protein [Falsarthrobacter nasiphocae]MDR6892587.1 glycosyltransferase involved in cell wall biosynthesis [Falsarthrobacter nasiphocae]